VRDLAVEKPRDLDAVKSLQSIRRRYYSLSLIYSFAGGFLFGVYPLFLRSRGLGQFEINSVMAIYFIVIFLTDVPTGAFADAMGRRNAMLMGCGLRMAGFLAYFFAHRYVWFIIAELLDGIGTTFCNGAVDAWGVDALDAAGFAGLRDQLFSRISQLMHIGFMASALIGAYVADYNIAWPWLLGAAGYLLCAIIAALMMTGGGMTKGHAGATNELALETLASRMRQRIIVGIRKGLHRRTILMLSLANGILFATWAPYWMEWPQVVANGYGIGIWVIGWVFCLFTLGHLVGTEIVARTSSLGTNRSPRLTVLALGAAATFFAAGRYVSSPSIMVAFLVAFRAFTGAMQPLISGWLNEQIQADERATLLSFNSTFATLGGSGGLILAGLAADRWGIAVTWQFLAFVALGAAACFRGLRDELPVDA
jgi:MFS family permease